MVGGIDTHKDLHMAAVVVDRDDGRLLETKDFSTTRAGYRALLRWMRQHGALESVGIEGTGSYGAGIMRLDEFGLVRNPVRPHKALPSYDRAGYRLLRWYASARRARVPDYRDRNAHRSYGAGRTHLERGGCDDT